jgi:hypothetical protein
MYRAPYIPDTFWCISRSSRYSRCMTAIIIVVEVGIEKATRTAMNNEADIDLNPTGFL